MKDESPADRSAFAVADLLDMGAGRGERVHDEARRFGASHPIGIELNRAKVARARAAGVPVYQGDFMRLDLGMFPSVKIVAFDNVLEHLASLIDVEAAFAHACALASHVVYIRHPSFEHADYLASIGLKQYWTDWPGVHTAPVRLDEFVTMALRHSVYSLSVRPLKCAPGSDDPTILPLSAQPNQHKLPRSRGAYGLYDETIHGAKPFVAFDRPIYFAFDLFFLLRPDAPTVRYDADTDLTAARPCLVWPDRQRSTRTQFRDRATNAVTRRIRRLRSGRLTTR